MKKYIPLEKRSKKEQKQYHRQSRVYEDMDMGTKSFKTAKYPSRASIKDHYRKTGEWDR